MYGRLKLINKCFESVFSLTTRKDGQNIVNALFKDKKNVLLKLQRKSDRSEFYTLIQPHPSFANTDFGVLVNNFSGYTAPMNAFMKDYILLGIIPKSAAQNHGIPLASNSTGTQFSSEIATQIRTASYSSIQHSNVLTYS